ncbi:MMPL family transporter [Deltaproteobacteria bacterium TL4]
MLKQFYERLILKYPRSVLTIVVIVIALLGYQARKLEVDASAETLLLENDKDLQYTRLVTERYKSPDFLFITYVPKGDLLSDKTLENIRNFKQDLLKLEMIASVTSILDVPLLESPPRPIQELLKDIPTLESPGINKELAKKELLNSPIYRNLLVSADFKTTAIQADLHEDPRYQSLLKRRNLLHQKEKDNSITEQERLELTQVSLDFKQHRDKVRAELHAGIAEVRALMDKYRGDADLFLGGVSMISDDLINFVKNDLELFGIGVFLFLVITLKVIFKQLRWIVIPLISCAFSVIATCGFLGMFNWEVTVISSNFISIQLIITMALSIHLVVRYRELISKNPEAEQHELVLDTVLFMASPCLYAILTTIAGFCSLILSGILPVINFGWMMSVGTGLSLLITFLIFPTIVVQMNKVAANTSFESNFGLTRVLSKFTDSHGNLILVVSALVFIFSIIGVSRLVVENSFIDYFKDTTEIYRGMRVIDQQFGGTTPLDVTLDFGDKQEPPPEKQTDSTTVAGTPEEGDGFGDFADEFDPSQNEAQYWFTSDKMETIEKVHDYLDSIPATGKVMSLATMLKVGRNLNDGQSLDNFKLALIYKELPERFRKIILSPYVSVENNQVRFSVLVRDSDPTLRRNELIKSIRNDLIHKVGLQEDRFHLANLLILYNNMLQSLYHSQIATLGAVIGALMIMFLVLFRSLLISIIAIIPNILSVGFVLGFMGWAKIPLDMMTITIASISVGMAVDNTIHYIHRFKSEFPKDRNYIATMHRCHASIGYAMYYTSITVIVGFSILVISNFIPSIYFGMLTGLAMLIALLAALTLLPKLITVIKPFGPEGGTLSN